VEGGAVGLMAGANKKLSLSRRHVHLFDSFEEICAPNETVDGKVAVNQVKALIGKSALTKGELIPLRGIYDTFGGPGDIETCKKLIEDTIKYPSSYIHYHKGWFQNTLPEESKQIEQIAILRLDGDWYESIKVCLDHLYHKVTKGGFVIIDDYGLYAGCKKAVDEFLSSLEERYYLHYSSYSCRYFLKT
jgi:O-methyltransferase